MQDDIDLKACIHGDKRAWDALVDRSLNLIYAAVQRCAGTRGSGDVEVDDIVQDVYAKLVRDDYRLLRQFDASKASLVTYLTLIARSTTLDAVKRRRLDAAPLSPEHDPPGESDPTPTEAPPPVGTTIPLETLSERQQLILHLLFDRGMSVAEAAGVLNVDPQTVRSGKHKALTKLRETLGSGDESRQSLVERE
jgi:RNA polymerase sigma-70 factor (ECF subfamily)